MATSGLSRRAPLASASAAVLALLLAGCQEAAGVGAVPDLTATPTAPGTASPPVTTTATVTPRPASVTVSPAHRSAEVAPSTAVVVTAETGTLHSVIVTDESGAALTGRKDATGRWTSTRLLRPATRYTVRAKAFGIDGTPSTTTSAFSTLNPRVTATYAILYSGVTVGVGMPVSIQFDSAVTTEQMRAEVERRVSVTTTPAQPGAWGWLDNRQLMWRPAAYWAPGTKVTVNAPLTGVQTGPGKWIANDDSGSFTVGSSMISTVDIKAHTMTVRRGGAVLRRIPVSTGRPGPQTETRSGTKVIIRKEGRVTMDSSTVGIPKGHPEYYRLDTDWNLRVTWTGEYLHSAPWSVGAQGSANVSHGCVNMSPADARWMFEHSKVGDVVRFTGSSRPFLPHEGIGVWQYDFAGWKAQSAIA
jgi:lipoprotein-anchoring transpeptidase ErfK/SrfK